MIWTEGVKRTSLHWETMKVRNIELIQMVLLPAIKSNPNFMINLALFGQYSEQLGGVPSFLLSLFLLRSGFFLSENISWLLISTGGAPVVVRV